MQVSGRSVLVTGGSRGIGLELARSFASRGARVAVCSRAEEAPSGLDGFRSQIRHFTCDLSRVEEVQGLADRVRTEWGAPGILVNNAGVQFNHDWAETSAEDRVRWAHTELCVNTMAPTLLTAHLLDDLRAAAPGVVVNVTSLLALSPKPSAPVYSASKAAMRSFTQALRWQLADQGSVRVVEVVPPMVDTAMTAGRGARKMQPAEAAEQIVQGLEKGSDEIHLGVAGLVHLMSRVAPPLATAILKRS